jgi:hypothetical protein
MLYGVGFALLDHLYARHSFIDTLEESNSKDGNRRNLEEIAEDDDSGEAQQIVFF